MPLTKVLDRCVSETEAAALDEGRAKEGGPGAELVDALNDPLLWLRPLPALLVLVALTVQAVGVWRYGRVPDGVYLEHVLGLGTLLALFLIGHALTHSVALARTLLHALRALSLHPLASAFASIGDRPFLWRLSFGAPTGGDLAPLLLSVGGVSQALEDDWRIQTPGWPLVLGLTFPLAPDEARRPFNATKAWQSLGGPCSTLVALLKKKQWSERPYPEGKGARPSPWHEAESFLALHVAYVIKHALVRVTRSLAFVIAGLMLVMAAHLFYTFEGRGFWLGLDWALLGLGVLVAILLLVAFEKDPILSRLWGSEPGQIAFRSEFVQRILLYGALPVITLFTTFFPEVGASLFAWLEPVRKALP